MSEKDYLETPKESGYRSIHLTYAYQGEKEEYKNFKVEVQIRSKVQHAWSTAVEVVGTFLGNNLKASQGDEKWLNFFKVVSQRFASLEESNKATDEIKKEIKQQTDNLNIINKLEATTVIAKHSKATKGYYLLELDMRKKTVLPTHYSEKKRSKAEEEYRRLEQEISEDPTQDVVLVAADSLSELKQAFPNYFGDTSEFITYLKLLTD